MWHDFLSAVLPYDALNKCHIENDIMMNLFMMHSMEASNFEQTEDKR